MEKQLQVLLPSVHLYELFMPIAEDEKRMVEVVKRTADIGFYRGIELGILFDRYSRIETRRLVEKNQWNLMQFATPYLKARGLSLCSLDAEQRKEGVRLCKELIKYAGDTGCTNLGIPSGDDPGDGGRKEAKKILADVIKELAGAALEEHINITLEPLDRYAYKKQLIGPMKESVLWFAPIKENCSNVYIHWDSAHEALGQTDLMQSLEYAREFIAQLHLCNAILDQWHPCYGDLHMDVGQPPDFLTEGFLTPEIGAQIIKKAASFQKADGIRDTYVSVEQRSHPGDDMWEKEKTVRIFLQKCFALADVMP